MNPGAALLDLLFPRKCPFCQRLVEGDALLCPDCQRTLPWLTEKAAERSPDSRGNGCRICRRGCRHRAGGEPGAAAPAEKVVITAFLSTIGTKHRESVLKG